MAYQYFRLAPHDSAHEKRQYINEKVGAAIDAGPAGPSIQLLTQIRHIKALGLAVFFSKPALTPKSGNIIRWILRYGHPTLVRRLVEICQSEKITSPIAGLLTQANTDDILRFEHLQPEIQIISTRSKPRSALICFCGNALQLNIEVQLFHFLAARQFDRIIYLRDPQRQRFTRGLPPLMNSITELINWLSAYLPSRCKVSVIGTSGGGQAAIALAESHPAARVILFSPPFGFNDETDSVPKGTLATEQVRLFFANQNAIDIAAVAKWQHHQYADSLRILTTETHATLQYLTNQGRFNDVIAWLKGHKLEL